MGVGKIILVWDLFDELLASSVRTHTVIELWSRYLNMHREVVAEEQRKVLDELLIPVVAGVIYGPQIGLERYYVRYTGHDSREHMDELIVILRLLDLQAADLRQALHGDIPELRLF